MAGVGLGSADRRLVEDSRLAPCLIVAEPAQPLTVARRTAVLQAAVAAAPLATGLRGALVDRLMAQDRFADALAVIEDWPAAHDSFVAQRRLAQVRLVPHSPAGDAAALAAAARAAVLATTACERADALALRAKAERRHGDRTAARATLEAALALDPTHVDACKRLAALMIEAGDDAGVIALTDGLIARGIAHPQVLNARAVAQARLGDVAAARATVGFERFGHRAVLAPPPGFADLAAFNAAAMAELVAHPAAQVDPHGCASRATTRVDTPTSGDAPLATLLMERITQTVATWVQALPADPHPWRCACPARGVVHGTCAITGAHGFETWHIHQQGWLSGVYYLAVPDAVVTGEGPGGCIAFGLDPAFAGAEAGRAYGETLIRPAPGMLLLFPSHAYHRTYPHGAAGLRVCMAFDLWPR